MSHVLLSICLCVCFAKPGDSRVWSALVCLRKARSFSMTSAGETCFQLVAGNDAGVCVCGYSEKTILLSPCWLVGSNNETNHYAVFKRIHDQKKSIILDSV